MVRRSGRAAGPSLRAVPFDAAPGDGVTKRLLTDKQRQTLAALATTVTFAPRRIVYHEGAQTTAVYICSEGALKAFKDLRSGRRRITAFLFPDDLFGLAKEGRYTSTVQAMMRTTCHRLPIDPLKALLRQDAELEFQFLCKVVHELRELQHRTIMMGRRSAAGRLAMFLRMLEHNLSGASSDGVIRLPMSRADIAGYLGLSAEAVSRAFTELADQGILRTKGVSLVKVIDRKLFEEHALDS